MLRGSDIEQPCVTVGTPSVSTLRTPTKDSEGLIPLQSELYFVVDCPSLHIVGGDIIGPRRQAATDPGFSTFDYASCPQCQQIITRTRQIIIPPSFPSPDLGLHENKFRFGEIPRFCRPFSTPLPEVVPLEVDSSVEEKIPATALSKPSRKGFLSRFGRPSPAVETQKVSRRAKSFASQSSSGSILPKYLSFCFSLSGKNLILWKKDSQALVRIELESYASRLLDLTSILPAADEVSSVNIRHVAEGNDWICLLISQNRQLFLLVLHSSGLREESTIHFIDERLEPKALAISPDNSFIAIGFGPRVYLFHYGGCHQQWHIILAVPDFKIPAEVKFQAINFSSDNNTLVVATQRHDIFRSTEDDTISTYIWRCTEHPPPPQKMRVCKMPTDGQGLASIYYSSSLSLSLILGASPSPYPFFLSPSSSPPLPIPNNITEFRVRCACLSPPPNNHIAYMMDVKNKVFKIDLSARSVVQIGDLNLERGALAVREEAAAIGVTMEGKIRIFWRQGGGLWVFALGGEGFAMREKEKTNLRALWEDAGGGS